MWWGRLEACHGSGRLEACPTKKSSLPRTSPRRLASIECPQEVTTDTLSASPVGSGLHELDVGEPGPIRRRREPETAGSNPAIQTENRKGKPTGDGNRLLPGRGASP